MRHFFKSLLILLSKLLFTLLIIWIWLLIYSRSFHIFDRVMLYIFLLASILLFASILGYAIHSKQTKSYLKSVAWIIGTPIFLIITYVIVAIVTHDPIVPRPLTVHQLLTGYNIVYTHDGKLYQNDEYVMDLEDIYWDTTWEYTNRYWRVDVYGSLYLSDENYYDSFLYKIDMKQKTSGYVEQSLDFTSNIEKPYYKQNPYHPDKLWMSILSNDSWYLIRISEPITNEQTTNNEIKPWTEYIHDHYNKGTKEENIIDTHYIRNTVSWSGDITNEIKINLVDLQYSVLTSILSWIIIDQNSELQLIWIVDEMPVITINDSTQIYTIQWNKLLFSLSGDYIFRTQIINNNIYTLSQATRGYRDHSKGFSERNNPVYELYKNGEEIYKIDREINWDWFIESDLCQNIGLRNPAFCLIEWKISLPIYAPNFVYLFDTIDLLYGVAIYGSMNIINSSIIEYGMTNTIWRNKNPTKYPKIVKYHNVISNIIGYLYHIRGSFNSFKEILSSRNLYRILSDHYFSTDTIFLRPFHDSGREYSEIVPLISWIDNFFGIYPTTPPENNDPNADINVGQLIMDTYFPQEQEPAEEIDEQTLLFELLKQRETRLEMETDNVYSTGIKSQ